MPACPQRGMVQDPLYLAWGCADPVGIPLSTDETNIDRGLSHVEYFSRDPWLIMRANDK